MDQTPSLSGIIGAWTKSQSSSFLSLKEERKRTGHALYLLIFALIGLGTMPLIQITELGWLSASRFLGAELLVLAATAWLVYRGQLEWAAKIVCFSVLGCGLLLMLVTGAGFRDLAMHLFPMILIIAAILLDWTLYLVFSGLVLTSVAAVGVFLVKSGARLQYPRVAITVFMLMITAVTAGLLVRNLRTTLWRSRESERRFRELLEHVRVAACIIDTKGIVLYCNEYLLAQTGWTAAELLGRPSAMFTAPEHRAMIADAIATSLATGRVTPFHVAAAITKDGKRRWFEWFHSSMRGDDGAIVAFANLGVDVTDHHLLKEQYLQSQRLEGLGRLSGAIAHDFNNLITVIRGYADLLLKDLRYDDPLRTPVDHICDASDKASDLTKQLLAFSRKQSVQPRPMDLNQAVSGLRYMMRLLLGPKIEFSTQLDDSLGLIMADPGQINQVLINFAANSRDAMPDGGKFTIETAAIPSKLGSTVMLSVSDTGTGMSQEVQEHIFEPFYTTKPEGKGTGLGLATVYGIVMQSQGSISVQSELGVGTNFTIYFPMLIHPAVDVPAAEMTPMSHYAGLQTGPL